MVSAPPERRAISDMSNSLSRRQLAAFLIAR